MNELSRLNLYQSYLDKFPQNDNREIKEILTINRTVLQNIESLFITDDSDNIIEEKNLSSFYEILAQNNEMFPDYDQYLVGHTLINELKNKIKNLTDPSKRKKESKDIGESNYFEEHNEETQYEKKKGSKTNSIKKNFRDVLSGLSKLNNTFVNVGNIEYENECPVGYTPVFLSYSFDDKLYTLALYKYFYEKKIWLYIDWMHNKKQRDGKVLKKILSEQLIKSEQLLFLRSATSELHIDNSYYIRPWCSWEFGIFYGARKQNIDEKYYINLYSPINSISMQLHGMKRYTNVNVMDNRLEGIW